MAIDNLVDIQRTVKNLPVADRGAAIYAIYQSVMSVHKVGEMLGVCGETVRFWLKSGGFCTKPHRTIGKAKGDWSDEDFDYLKQYYANTPSKDFSLKNIARFLGKTHASVAIKASRSELGDFGRPKKEKRILRQAELPWSRWVKFPHPRGMAGKHHTEALKQKNSVYSREWAASISASDRDEMNYKILKTKLEKYGTLAAPRHKVSWKQGWREIGGNRIYFRSRWEFNYSVYLQWIMENGKIKKWEHEPVTFWFEGIKRGCMTYLPDFRVTNIDDTTEFHEVKGWMDDRSKTKIARMAKYHPMVKLIVIDAKWFKANGRTLSFLPLWEK